MSRQTRSAPPVSTRLLEPAPKITKQVTAHLRSKRLSQKRYYDSSSRLLQPLAEGRVVRIQTDKGHDRLGTVKERCKKPRSYIIESDGGTYRRNRRHILPVAEPSAGESAGEGAADFDRQCAASAAPDGPPSTPQTPQLIHAKPQRPTSEQRRPAAHSPTEVTLGNSLYATRSGRICRPNPKYEQ